MERFKHIVKRSLLHVARTDADYGKGWEGTLATLLHQLPYLHPYFGKELRSLGERTRQSSGQTLLDVGCGDGAFVCWARSLGWDAQGLDPDPDAVRVAREQFRVPVIEGNIEDVELTAHSFDVIRMSHVIEHVEDPIRVLEICRSWLKPRGTLMILTPNADSWGHHVFGRAWMHLDQPRHFHIFTPRNLSICAARAGLNIERVFTTARGAPYVYHASSVLRTAPTMDLRESGGKLTASGLLFRFVEELTRLTDPGMGEEIRLHATRD